MYSRFGFEHNTEMYYVSTEFDFIYLAFYYVVMLWLQWRKKKYKGI